MSIGSEKIGKCAAAALLVLMLIVSAALPVCGATDEVTYELTREGTQVSLLRVTEDTGFWEAPVLGAGQTRTGGRLTLRNSTDRTATFTLHSIELPYDLRDALVYLDAVNIVVKDGSGGEVYYSGTYSHIADNRAPAVQMEVPAGGTRTLEMSISCAYGYTGSVPASRSIVWNFGAELQSPAPTIAPTQIDMDIETRPLWHTILLYAAVAAGIFLLLGLTAWLLRKLRR